MVSKSKKIENLKRELKMEKSWLEQCAEAPRQTLEAECRKYSHSKIKNIEQQLKTLGE